MKIRKIIERLEIREKEIVTYLDDIKEVNPPINEALDYVYDTEEFREMVKELRVLTNTNYRDLPVNYDIFEVEQERRIGEYRIEEIVLKSEAFLIILTEEERQFVETNTARIDKK